MLWYTNLPQSVTLLKLNTAVGEDLSASLALSVVDLLASHESEVGRVIVVAAVQPPKRLKVRCGSFFVVGAFGRFNSQ